MEEAYPLENPRPGSDQALRSGARMGPRLPERKIRGPIRAALRSATQS